MLNDEASCFFLEPFVHKLACIRLQHVQSIQNLPWQTGWIVCQQSTHVFWKLAFFAFLVWSAICTWHGTPTGSVDLQAHANTHTYIYIYIYTYIYIQTYRHKYIHIIMSSTKCTCIYIYTHYKHHICIFLHERKSKVFWGRGQWHVFRIWSGWNKFLQVGCFVCDQLTPNNSRGRTCSVRSCSAARSWKLPPGTWAGPNKSSCFNETTCMGLNELTISTSPPISSSTCRCQ